MRASSFVLLIILIDIFVMIVDLYFIRHWRRYIKLWKLNELFYKIPFFFVLPMGLLAVYTTSFRLKDPVISDTMMILFSIVILWYFPKILFLPIFLIKDFIDIVICMKRTIFPHKIDIETHHISSGRRKFLKTAAWSLSPIPFMYVADGLVKTTRNVRIYSSQVYINNLPSALDGIKIAQISDIHAGSFSNSSVMKETRERIKEVNPDILLVTGDFVNFDPSEWIIVQEEFNKLEAPFGVYGVLGNHDHYMSDQKHYELVNLIKKSPVDLLINENRIIKINGEDFQLAGIDNLGFRQTFGDIDKALVGLDEKKFILLMSHDPSAWPQYIIGKKKIDLTLSGHTHGGQVGLEFFGKELSPADLVYNYWAGLYTKVNQHLYVNRGLGTTGPPIRLAFEPEVTSLTLRKA